MIDICDDSNNSDSKYSMIVNFHLNNNVQAYILAFINIFFFAETQHNYKVLW